MKLYGTIVASMNTVRTIGIIGGGQLGRMLTLAAKPLGFKVVVLEATKECPAGQVGAEVVEGDLYDEAAIKKLAARADVVTVEIEHLNTDALQKVSDSGTPVHPAAATIALIQDKYRQKQALQEKNIAVADFKEVPHKDEAKKAIKEFGGSMILKAKHGAYDGRGNAVVKSASQLDTAWEGLGGKELYAERLVDFKKELSVIVARSLDGAVKVYDVVEMQHERSICLEVMAPAQISKVAAENATALARQVVPILEGAGVFAIEMFLLEDESVLVNEIAPRVHNSGHHTINACITSQFEQHVRAVTGLPLGETNLRSPAVMVNILGTYNGDSQFNPLKPLEYPDTHIHWYGKSPVKVDRKMGHITALADTVKQASVNANKARRSLNV